MTSGNAGRLKRLLGGALLSDSLAGESKQDTEQAGFDDRLRRYATAKLNALTFSRYLRAENELNLAVSLARCGNHITFRDYYTIGQIRLSKICTCHKHLLCPLCALRRGAKGLRVTLGKVTQLLASDASLKPYLVTMTIKNGPDLDERNTHLCSCLRKMHKRRKGKDGFGEILKAVSAVWSYEYTNKGKGWHPHVHAIWLCREAPDQTQLSREWHELTGDSYIVDVRPMDESDPVGAFCEVFKYALKFSDLADPDRLHAYKTLKGKRLQDSFGELRGLDIEPGESDVLLDDLPYIERLFRFSEHRGYVESLLTRSRSVPADLEVRHAA